MKKKVSVTGANLLFFVFVMLFLIFQIILTLLTAIKGPDFVDQNIYEVLLVNQYVLILIPVIVFMLLQGHSFKEVFRLNNPGFLPSCLIIACSVPAYFVASFINTLVAYLLQFVGNLPTQPIPVPQNPMELLTGILVVAVSPAICEELLHRGILLKAYENRGTVKAIFITSILFGFFHFDITNFFGPIFLGILIGYYVIRTNSIFAGMLAHFANNAIAELLQYLVRNEIPTGNTISIKLQELGVIAIYGIIGLVLLAVLLLILKKVTDGKPIIVPSISTIKDDFVSIASHWPIVTVLVLYTLLGGLYLVSIIIDKYTLM